MEKNQKKTQKTHAQAQVCKTAKSAASRMVESTSGQGQTWILLVLPQSRSMTLPDHFTSLGLSSFIYKSQE